MGTSECFVRLFDLLFGILGCNCGGFPSAIAFRQDLSAVF